MIDAHVESAPADASVALPVTLMTAVAARLTAFAEQFDGRLQLLIGTVTGAELIDPRDGSLLMATVPLVAPLAATAVPVGSYPLGSAAPTLGAWVLPAAQPRELKMLRDAGSVLYPVLSQIFHRRVQREALAFTVVGTLQQAMNEVADFASLAHAVYGAVSRLFVQDAFNVLAYDAGLNYVCNSLSCDGPEVIPDAFVGVLKPTTLSGWLIRQQTPLLLGDLGRDLERYPAIQPVHFGSSHQVRAWLGVPLLVAGRVVGVLSVQSYTPNRWTVADQRLLSQVALPVALAVDKQRLLDQRDQQIGTLEAQRAIGTALSTVRDLPTALETTLRVLQLPFPNESYVLVLLDQAGVVTSSLNYEHSAAGGLVWDQLRGRPLNPAGILSLTLRERLPLFFNTLEERVAAGLPTTAPIADSGTPASVSVMTVPLFDPSGAALGAIAIQSARQHAFDERQLALLDGLGKQIAAMVTTAQLNTQTAEQQTELANSYQSQQQLTDIVRELSAPIVPVYDGILVLPLVGSLDAQRAQDVTERLLEAIVAQQAEVVIIDITGVPVVDTNVANHLLQAARGVRLLGSQVILTGISAHLAQTIVQLGLDLRSVTTCANLQVGVQRALELCGRRIV